MALDEYQHLRHSADEAERLRRERHLAAFMGDCGVRTCEVCHPADPPVYHLGFLGIPPRSQESEDRWIEALRGGRQMFGQRWP